MASYKIDELIIRHETERFTSEQAIGHCLQHIKMLTQQQTDAAKSRTRLNQQLESLSSDVKSLQAEIKQLHSAINN